MSTLSAATLVAACFNTLVVAADLVDGATTSTNFISDSVTPLVLVVVAVGWLAYLIVYCRDTIVDRIDRMETQAHARALGIGLTQPRDQPPVPESPRAVHLAAVTYLRPGNNRDSGRVS